MTSEEVYKYHTILHQFPLPDFKKWDKKMVKLTDKHRQQIEENIKLFKLHHSKIERKTATSRGKLFWRHHVANDLLVEDFKSGKA